MMLVSCVGVTISVIAMVAINLVNQRRAMVENLESIASIVTSNSTAAVTFKDRLATAEILAALRDLSAIEFASVHLRDSSVLATYGKPPPAADGMRNELANQLPPSSAGRIAAGEKLVDVIDRNVLYVADRIFVFSPIVLDGERIGTLRIVANTEQLWQVGISGILSGMAVLLLTALLAYALSRRLQHTVSEPVVNLYQTMVKISETKDYGLRAAASETSRIEEISTLIDGFNEMLSQLEHRESELVSANEALRAGEERLENAQEIAGLGYWYWDEDQPARTYVSPKWAEFFGLASDHLKVPLDAFLGYVHQQDRDQVRSAVNQALRNGENYDLEYRIVDSGGQTRYLHERVQYRPATGGGTGRLEGIGQEVTNRYIAEQERQALTHQLYDSQKREALGTLAGGVAHDFNNILAIISGYTNLALERISEDDEAAEYIRQVTTATERARDLVSQILMYSRTDSSRFEGICVADILEESMSLLRATLPATIEFNGDIGGKQAWINGNATQIHQVAMNLCVNASHAIGSRHGNINVKLEEIDIDPRSNATMGMGIDVEEDMTDDVVALDPQAGSDMMQLWVSHPKPGKYLKLSVTDSGEGIRKDAASRIFDPFFTTRKVGDGTGLGLAAVRGIVINHGGAIHVESDEGEGSCFSIFLPVSDTVVAPAAAAPENEDSMPGNMRILCVDDEPELVDITSQTLSMAGHTVDGYTDSFLALEAFRAAPDTWDVVITDYTMPRMTGVELATEIFNIRDDLPIILCSGFADNVEDELGHLAGVLRLANKPIVGRKMVALIENAVQAASDGTGGGNS